MARAKGRVMRAIFWMVAIGVFLGVGAVKEAHAFCVFGCTADRKCKLGCPALGTCDPWDCTSDRFCEIGCPVRPANFNPACPGFPRGAGPLGGCTADRKCKLGCPALGTCDPWDCTSDRFCEVGCPAKPANFNPACPGIPHGAGPPGGCTADRKCKLGCPALGTCDPWDCTSDRKCELGCPMKDTCPVFNCTPDRLCQVGCPPKTTTSNIDANWSTVPFTAAETCDQPDNGPLGSRTGVVPFDRPTGLPLYFATQMPSRLLDVEPPVGQAFLVQPDTMGPAMPWLGLNEGRLRADLRSAARWAHPLTCSLHVAAIYFARGDAVLGNAFADLSVTGRMAFDEFKKAPPGRRYCDALSEQPIDVGCGAPPPASPATGGSDLAAGCFTALDRAYAVANFLRTGQVLQTHPDKLQERNALGWIAVSGEDDQPHRPVNVPSSDFPQYDLDVVVEAPMAPGGSTSITVRTRYTVAQSRPPALSPPLRRKRFTLGLEPAAPSIAPDADVLLFIHGMDSRAEEATDITNQLFALQKQNNRTRNLVIVSLDLPTSGYSENLDHLRIATLEAVGMPKTLTGTLVPYAAALKNAIAAVDFQFSGNTPLLDFIETFIVRFVEQLDAAAPIKDKIKAVMGGSLGGNMTFRLGRRCRSEMTGVCLPGVTTNMDWLPAFVVWSPASIWNSLGEGADLTKHIAPLRALIGASDRDPGDAGDRLLQGRVGRRAEFFGSWNKPIVPILVPMAQSDTWQSDFYGCKKTGLVGARLDRQETYDPLFLLWHWRLGAEQLLYSHQTEEPAGSGKPRFKSNVKRMLLACGVLDNVPWNDICGAVQRTAPQMTTTPGKAVFLEMTGHSVDNERRMWFAGEITTFLGL